MIQVKLTSIMVNDQDRARDFYTNVLGFVVKHDVPMGNANWLTVVAPNGGDIELLLEPTGHPAAKSFQKALYDDGIPLTQLNTDDIHTEYRRLKDKGVIFKDEPKSAGPTLFADFDDTCGNFIQLVQG